MPDLPFGTITFLFTDIAGSTKLWEHYPDAMRTALTRHDYLLRQAIEANGGAVVKSTGDGILAAFATAPDGVTAALALQQSILSEKWQEQTRIRVRAALHVGTAEYRDGDY
jgi:class 3 adenylate cyclase